MKEAMLYLQEYERRTKLSLGKVNSLAEMRRRSSGSSRAQDLEKKLERKALKKEFTRKASTIVKALGTAYREVYHPISVYDHRPFLIVRDGIPDHENRLTIKYNELFVFWATIDNCGRKVRVDEYTPGIWEQEFSKIYEVAKGIWEAETDHFLKLAKSIISGEATSPGK